MKKTLKFRSTTYHEKLYELAHAITQDYFLNTHTILLPKHLLYSDQFFYHDYLVLYGFQVKLNTFKRF